MEIKATLNKPYTEQQRVEFIVAQNHQFGYKIEETNVALEAWGYTEEEIAQQQVANRRSELIEQLDAIDLKCIRAVRAIQAGVGTSADTERLVDLETQAESIRQQIQDL